jgi:hypothetical protein
MPTAKIPTRGLPTAGRRTARVSQTSAFESRVRTATVRSSTTPIILRLRRRVAVRGITWTRRHMRAQPAPLATTNQMPGPRRAARAPRGTTNQAPANFLVGASVQRDGFRARRRVRVHAAALAPTAVVAPLRAPSVATASTLRKTVLRPALPAPRESTSATMATSPVFTTPPMIALTVHSGCIVAMLELRRARLAPRAATLPRRA